MAEEESFAKRRKELWQKTYRNSDIDYIQIKYEESGTRGSHNYRVQMVSGGAERVWTKVGRGKTRWKHTCAGAGC